MLGRYNCLTDVLQYLLDHDEEIVVKDLSVNYKLDVVLLYL